MHYGSEKFGKIHLGKELVVGFWSPMNSILLFGFQTMVQIFIKTEWEYCDCNRSDRHTDTQMWVILLGLSVPCLWCYATCIAMGQIIIQSLVEIFAWNFATGLNTTYLKQICCQNYFQKIQASKQSNPLPISHGEIHRCSLNVWKLVYLEFEKMSLTSTWKWVFFAVCSRWAVVEIQWLKGKKLPICTYSSSNLI